MPLVLLIVLIALAAGTSLLFLSHRWLPLLAATQGAGFDHQLHLTLAIFGAAFLVVQIVLAILIWRFHRSKESSRHGAYPQGRLSVELGAIVLTTGIFVGLGIKGGALTPLQPIHADMRVLQVEVTGMQFQWYFRYPGSDGKFGITRPELVDASAGNPLGLDGNDPAAKDDIVASQLVLPLNQPVEFLFRAQDVVHSFYVPAMRLQMSVVPGMTTHAALTPTQAGTFELVCNQLCGLGHYRMHGIMNVLPQGQYAKWLEQHRLK
jgi:cytochrome c oxidase subunit II